MFFEFKLHFEQCAPWISGSRIRAHFYFHEFFRFGSCRDSVVEEVFSSPLRRSRLDLSLSTSPSKRANSPIKSFALDEEDGRENGIYSSVNRSETMKASNKFDENVEDEEDDGSFKFAQKKRLKALASKFSNYEEEDSDAIKPILAQASATGSPYKKDLTKTVDVDQIINRNAPATHNLNSNDPDFVKSLKAQGFEESSSKSKLVYDFKRKTTNHTPTGSRDASPYKNDPMQYIRPQQKLAVATPPKSNPTKSSPTKDPMQYIRPQPKLPAASPPKSYPSKSSPTKKPPAYRSVSPTRMASPRTEPSNSVKPHPLQFVSPQKANATPAAGPPKPPRTYIDMEEESPTEINEIFKNETGNFDILSRAVYFH